MNSARASTEITSGPEVARRVSEQPAAPAADRLRILMVNSTLHIGGAEQVAANLAQHLDRGRFEVSACYLKENGIVGQHMREAGVDLVPIPGLKRGRDYLTSLKLRKLVRERRIQLLHTHDVHGFIDACACRLIVPGLRHVHTFHFGNYPHIPPRYARIERTLWRIPDVLVAVGHEQAAAIRKMHGIPPSRLRVIWNGTDAPTANIAPEVTAQLPASGIPVLASISTLIPQKGLPDLLDAVAILRQQGRRFALLVVGEGKLRAELEAQAERLGLKDMVRFLGWVQAASRRALPACDIFVQSSHWEAMSVVVLEAMAAGKAVVVTSVGENARVIVPGECGLVVAPGDPSALAAALARLLDDLALRHRLGSAAKQRFDKFFTVQHMIRNYEHLYAEVLGHTAPAPMAETA